MPIQLIVGLGNPGAEYAQTRHNAGAWLLESLLKETNLASLRDEKKFHGLFAQTNLFDHKIYLLAPTTYMNESGRSVLACANFYKIPPEEILVVHDDLDLVSGDIRLKQNGGHGGHNGLRDINACLNSSDFWRLRIGIGHPGQKDDVSDHVLSRASYDEQIEIDRAIDRAIQLLPDILSGDTHQVMQILHTKTKD